VSITGHRDVATLEAITYQVSHTPLERCCVHNMLPFVSSSGLSPVSREAKVQRSRSASIVRSQVWLGLPIGRFQSGGTCQIAAARALCGDPRGMKCEQYGRRAADVC